MRHEYPRHANVSVQKRLDDRELVNAIKHDIRKQWGGQIVETRAICATGIGLGEDVSERLAFDIVSAVIQEMKIDGTAEFAGRGMIRVKRL